MRNFLSIKRTPSFSFGAKRKPSPFSRVKESLAKAVYSQENQKILPKRKVEVIREERIHIKRLNAMYWANILLSGPIGLANLLAPKTMKRILKMPSVEPIHYGIASGAVPLAFGLAGVWGLRSPLRLSPVLSLQLAYKSLFLLGTVLPLAKKKRVPLYAAPLIGIYVFFLVGNLVARPFPYLQNNRGRN